MRVEVNPVIAKTRHTTEQLVKQQQEQQQKQQQQLDVDILRKGVEVCVHVLVMACRAIPMIAFHGVESI